MVGATGRLIRLAAVAALAVTAAAPPSPVAALAGRYYERFELGTVSGERYIGENIVEIVSVAPDAAYFRAELSFYNGHSCSIYGVARAEGDALVYRDPAPADDVDGKCTLTIRRADNALRLDDGDGGCQQYCGVRGSLQGIDLPFASRRPIRYMAKLKASEEYRGAMQERQR